MKKLHKLIITSYLSPFVLTMFITLFILVMQFLWKYIDELVGKDLEWTIIAEFLFYATAQLIPMALPLAILLSSIMTFGNFGENFELVAMKSSGLSIQKIMLPLFIFILMLSGGAFYFSNNIWPVANLKMMSLMYDIRHKKPTLDIQEGVFYEGVEGYVIWVKSKEKDGKTLNDVLIYDHTNKNGKSKMLKAEKGKMTFTKDERYMELNLDNGVSYEEMDDKKKRNTYPFLRSKFKHQIIRFDLTGFKMKRTDDNLFKGNYKMLNIEQLEGEIDTFKNKYVKSQKRYHDYIQYRFLTFRDTSVFEMNPALIKDTNFILIKSTKTERAILMESALNLSRSAKSYVTSLKNELNNRKRDIARYKIEWHRKFTLSVACIVLFFIGAPLGAIIRKGGLGLPVVISVIFFLIFHVISISGEKIAKQAEISAFAGMWMATACLFPLGMFLTYKATTDSAILDSEAYTRGWSKITALFSKLLKKSSA